MLPTIPGYHVLEVLARSRSSTVYRARREGGTAVVVLKTDGGDDPGAATAPARLAHEYGILRRLEVPGVVRALALERAGPLTLLVLEDVQGRSLARLLEHRRPTPPQVLELAIRVTAILEAVHARGVVHQDLNPANLIVSDDLQRVWLADFGIATRLARGAAGAAHPLALHGTLAYIAPEQTGRMQCEVDERADLYALGVTLYQLLAGRLPFQSDDPVTLVYRHLAEPPPPLRQLAPEVPEPLAAVVAKLLSKAPEERYLGAFGLRRDLLLCRTPPDGEAPFRPGRHDVMTRLRPPRKLYGRDAALARLREAVARTTGGERGLVLVTGPSGVGKSALVNRLRLPVVQARGLFLAGEFEPVQRDIPYRGLLQALRELVDQVLALDREGVDTWRQRVQAALGHNGRVLCELLPELELVIGPQPGVESLPAGQAGNRFTALLLALVRACAGPGHPLVLVLDGLQWADAASIDLLRLLLRDEECSHLLLIGAYREPEPGGPAVPNPLQGLLESAETGLERLVLPPLDREAMQAMLEAQFRHDPSAIAPLADAVFEKTRGNPFFTHLFLHSLAERGLLRFDPEQGCWDWELERIRRLAVTDNVAGFLAERLHTLPPDSRGILEQAACIGSRFDLATLALVAGTSRDQAAERLDPALAEQFVHPLDGGRERDGAGDEATAYRFVHSRVQQAAYERLPPRERSRIHYRIGRLFLERLQERRRGEELPYLVDQLNLGREQIHDPEERRAVAALNLEAGGRAKAAAAFAPARHFFEAGTALLPEDAWHSRPRLALDLHAELAQCQYLTGDLESAETGFDALLARGLPDLDQARIYQVRLLLYTAIGRYREAIDQGLAGLALLGMPLGRSPSAATLLREHLRVRRSLRHGDPAGLPPLEDPDREMVLELLVALGSPCYLSGEERLMALANLEAVGLSLRHGNGRASAYAYAGYALLLATVFREPQLADRLATEVQRLCETAVVPWYRSKALFILANAVLHWRHPLRRSLPLMQQALGDATDSGDNLFICYLGIRIPAHRFHMGDPLDAVADQAAGYLKLIRRTGDQAMLDNARLWLQIYRALQGRGSDLLDWDGPDFDRVQALQRMRDGNFRSGLAIHAIYRSLAHLLQQDFASAIRQARAAAPHLHSLLGLPDTVAALFYEALALASRERELVGFQRLDCRRRLLPLMRRLGRRARQCPANHLAGYALVRAEYDATRGRMTRAMQGYDRACREAGRNGLSPVTAMAREWAARFYRRNGFGDIALGYLRAAIRDYRRWGAQGKAAALQQTLAQWQPAGRLPTTAAPPDATSTGDLQLDLHTVIRAAETLSGEIRSRRLLERLIDLVVANAGARRGVLLLQGDGGLRVQAEREVASDRCLVLQSVPQEDYRALAQSVVNYVARSRRRLVLADASREGGFTADPHVHAQGVRSILCLPILRQTKLTGVLYLENNLAPGAFTAERVGLLSLLSSQMAISIENAELYRGLQQAARELERYNRELESKVQERTRELNQALVRVERANAQVVESLDYAKMIQESLLPRADALALLGRERFVLWLPRDAVGGDLFFVHRVGERVVLVLADCTGHGVPGALMTVIAVSALRQIVEVEGCDEPAAVLGRLNRMVRRTLRQDADGQRADNGMDAAACRLSPGGGPLLFAGARMALHWVQQGRLQVRRGDRHSLGYRRSDPGHRFATHELALAAGAWVYLASDGYPDQLGGERGFPMGGSRFRELLQAHHGEPAEVQKERLCQALDSYRGQHPRQDDVTLIGFRI